MIVNEENKRTLFHPNDYDRINEKYFKPLRDTGEIDSDFSFWYETEAVSSNYVEPRELSKYVSDYNFGIINSKELLLKGIGKWDQQSYKYKEITICGSTTTGSMIILGLLLTKNVKCIIFETPAYFASIDQSNLLKFEVHYVPTYIKNNFQIDNSSLEHIKKINDKKAIWLTQPRFGLGFNQNKETIEKIINFLNPNDFLIIDEATEQYYPSFLNDFNFKRFPNLIKFRSFFKGAGLNGPRISYILHHEKYRENIQNLLETFQGGIGYFSLNFAKKHIENEDFFKLLLNVSNNQVVGLRKKTEQASRGSNIVVNQLENGYIGTVALKLPCEKSYVKEREDFLKYCSMSKIAVIVGASMYFARDPEYEFIRVSYFNPEVTILRGISHLIKYNPKGTK